MHDSKRELARGDAGAHGLRSKPRAPGGQFHYLRVQKNPILENENSNLSLLKDFNSYYFCRIAKHFKLRRIFLFFQFSLVVRRCSQHVTLRLKTMFAGFPADYGAATTVRRGQPPAPASAGQGWSVRRMLLLAGCAVGSSFLLAAGLAAGARTARVEAVAEWPARLGQSALGSVVDGMRPGAPQQMTYGYANVKTPHYDSYLREQANYLHNQQNLGLSPALDRARQSQRDMSSLVNYYAQRSPAANPSAYAVPLPPPPTSCVSCPPTEA